MKTISIVNHKGGVGKTTTTFNFGGELAKRGYKVLLIDFDSQGNLTMAATGSLTDLAIKETVADALDCLIEDRELVLPIYPTAVSGMDIIPCNIRFANTIIKLNYAVARESYLKLLISKIKETCDYDYILIDNAPTIEISFQNSIVACDEVIIISEPDVYSIDGIATLISQINKINRYFNPDLKIAGILVNKMDNRTNYDKYMAEAIHNNWGNMIYVFNTIIPKSVKTAESQAISRLLTDFAPDNRAGSAFSAFTDEYLNIER